MKIEIALLLAYLSFSSRGDPIKAPLSLIGYDDVSPLEREHLAYLEEMTKQREKRSGHSLLSILGNGIKSKLGSLAKASAGSSAHFSSSSSGHYGHDHHEEHDYEHEHKTFDFWSLNKSILNTLLQAVKAIKGATIALTGKLIKGSGYLVSAKGKLISHGGDAVTSLGKKIATSAVLSPLAHGSHSSSYSEHPHEEYHSEYGQDIEVSPSAVSAEYGPGPDLSNKYLPTKYSSYEDKNSYSNLPEGILILKKMPQGHHEVQGQESHKVPDFKPIDPQTPSYKDILGSLLASASDSNSKGEDYEKFPPFDSKPSPSFNTFTAAKLPLEHKTPNLNYLQYFKDKQNLNLKPKPTMEPIKVYDFSDSMDAQSDFSEFNFAPQAMPMSFQSFSQYDDVPIDFAPQFPRKTPNFNTLDPRSIPKRGFLPTPLTNPEFPSDPSKPKRTRLKKPNVDVVKSITYELRPGGPVKVLN